MKIFKKSLICILMCTVHIYTTVIESPDMHSVLNHINDTHHHTDVLVIFDIDNTIAHVEDGFGGDEWFSALIQHEQNQGKTRNEILERLVPVYHDLQYHIWLTPVQTETPDIIKRLQHQGTPVTSLTSRSYPLLDRTVEQLDCIDVDFSHTAPHSNIEANVTMLPDSYYYHGILFAGNNNKGELLLHFFNTTGYYPKKVIFIDDKTHHVHQVKETMENNGIPCIGIRYSRLDDKVEQFNLADHHERTNMYIHI